MRSLTLIVLAGLATSGCADLPTGGPGPGPIDVGPIDVGPVDVGPEDGPEHEVESTASFAGPVERVAFDIDVGSLTVLVEDREDAALWRRARFDHHPGLHADLSAGVLYLWSDCPEEDGRCSVDHELALPASAMVEGALDVGSITLLDLDDLVDVETGTGTIEVLSSRSDEVYAAAGVGEIDIEVPAGAYDIEAETELGSVTLDGVVDHDGAEARLEAHTGVGDVTVRGR